MNSTVWAFFFEDYLAAVMKSYSSGEFQGPTDDDPLAFKEEANAASAIVVSISSWLPLDDCPGIWVWDLEWQ